MKSVMRGLCSPRLAGAILLGAGLGWTPLPTAGADFGGFSSAPSPDLAAPGLPGGEGAATTVALWLDRTTTPPGSTVLAGIHLRMKEGWHIYWRNPGDSGMATAVEWRLPPGVTAGEIQWPPPEIHSAGGIVSYTYSHEVTLLVPLTVASNVPPGALELKASVNWLECLEACVPGGGEVSAPLTVGPRARSSEHAPTLAEWRARVPRPRPALAATARWEGDLTGEEATLVITGKTLPDFTPTDFWAYGDDDYAINPRPAERAVGDGRFTLRKKASRFTEEWPRQLAGLLVQTDSDGRAEKAFEVTLIPGGEPAASAAEPPASGTRTAAPPPSGASRSAPPPPAPAPEKHSLGFILALAFLGGLILNVMPCVLPVIALKILGFVQQSQESPGRVRKLGLAYGAGVLASFLTMALVVIGVQQAGGGASWGMQMQNPYFRLALLLVVVLVALNLFGVFEINLSGQALGAASKLASREGCPGAFLNGVLATALGTSCTAPFLAVAVGFAFTQSAAVVLLLFLTIGAGLAFPYVLLSWHPAWLKFLPKPGPWMGRFKVAMGFPMLGTAVWMFEFTAPAYGETGVLWLGMFLVTVAVIAWIWGEFVQRGARRKGLARGIALALAAGAYAFILEGQLHWRRPVGPAAGGDAVVRDVPGGLEWHAWSPEAVARARKAGHVVLVDFTAKWCPNCRYNKKVAIDIPEVRQKLAALNGIVFRADFTNRDPRIARALKEHDRAGVPLVLVYPADPARPPLVLPPILTPGIVLEALEQAGEPKHG